MDSSITIVIPTWCWYVLVAGFVWGVIVNPLINAYVNLKSKEMDLGQKRLEAKIGKQ